MSNFVACRVYTGGIAMEIKSEADSDDMTDCPCYDQHDDRPTTGVFDCSDSSVTMFENTVPCLLTPQSWRNLCNRSDLYVCVQLSAKVIRKKSGDFIVLDVMIRPTNGKTIYYF